MKKNILLGILLIVLPLAVQSLPNHPFFNAMNDEMQRTMQKLQLQGSPRPYYVVYKLEKNIQPVGVGASLGEVTIRQIREPFTKANVLLSAGDAQRDSFGMEQSYWNWQRSVGNSYEDVRHVLWGLTNDAYLQASRWYENKQSYLRKKEAHQSFPDFIVGKQGSYTDKEIPMPAVDVSMLEELAKRLTAQGMKFSFVEQFDIWINPTQYQTFWLNNLGANAYINYNYMFVELDLRFRTKAGFERKINKSWLLDAQEDWKEELEQRVKKVLTRMEKMHASQEGTAYIGPVLLSSEAANNLWYEAFVKNMMEFGTVITADGKEKSGGSFKDKLGLRVVAPSIDVYDKPFLRTYNRSMVVGFSPLDDEGVVPQELTLVKDGYLREIPTSSRPFKEGVRTNGHGFAMRSFPREYLSNVVIEPHQPLTQEELERKLLEMCRAQELEYGYILYGLNDGDDGVPLAERIYVSDGHKEPVYGLRIETGIGPRLLRDIHAAGDQKSVARSKDSQVILSPALLLEEMELVPTNKKPDRKPFVPKP